VTDEHLPLRTRPATLLGRLQQVLQDDAPPERQRRPLDVKDRSLQVHACHGPARQVEVLRDVITGLLADDPTLEPRDVLVMCPDIEEYAPLISATFGLEDDESEEQHPAIASASGWRTGHCGRPTHCSARWPRCSTSRTPG